MSERAVRTGGNPGAPYFLAAGCAVVAQLLLFTVRPAARGDGGGSAERWHKGAGERLQDTAPPVALQAAIARSRSASDLEQLYILFIGANDSTGRSWCSDTRLARPLLTARLEGLPEGAVVLEAAVSREEWRRRDHPYRQHPVRTRPCGLSSAHVVYYVLRLGCVRAVAG